MKLEFIINENTTIKEFIYKYKKTYTNLKPGKLEDIGSIIFLTEE